MKYNSADEIDYTPENAVRLGIQVVQDIENYVRELNIASELRKDVWLRDIERLKNQILPRTLIAVFGVTGAGKSSLLNAILEDNIVPTSGMRACTAVVTEISHHDKDTIAATVEFIKLSEWRSDLTTLIHDLADENGKPKSISDLKSKARIAWDKVHAVYPDLKAESIITMTPDEIIGFDPQVAAILDTTEPIECSSSEEFGVEIAKYIDSQDQKKGHGTKMALWPLIRMVRISTKCNALSCGAVLVDLPGVADTSAARSSIAEDYMSRCDFIWIVAPIHRAVEDKIAQKLLGEAFKTQLTMDGNYNANKITFIASKTDDISPGEIIRALGLSELPELEEVNSKRENANAGKEESSTAEKAATEKAQGTAIQLEQLRLELDKLKDCSRRQTEKSFKLASIISQGTDNLGSKKRKHNADFSIAKRTRLHGGPNSANSNDASDSMDLDNPAEGSSGGAVVETWAARIDAKEQAINLMREQLWQQRQASLDAGTKAYECDLTLARLRMEKDAICSRKRNIYSKEALKADFREGLEQLNQSSEGPCEGANNPEGLNPSGESHDDSKIDLPVFTCSSRDYIRIRGQVKGDGGPICFTDPKDTEIPKLQNWCHKLTVPARQQSAHKFLVDIIAFLRTIESFANKMKGLNNISDRVKLSERWESEMHMGEAGGLLDLTQAEVPVPESETPRAARYRRRAFRKEQNCWESSLSKMVEEARNLLPPECHIAPQHINRGVAIQLRRNLNLTATECVKQLKRAFRDGILARCKAGATKAGLVAVETSDAFASMHWRTYLAALRNDGEWKERNLNAELVKPMACEIAVPWARVFRSDANLFAATSQAAKSHINSLLDDLVASAPPDFRVQCEAQCQFAREEAELVVNNLVQKITTVITNEQKIISRCLTPQVKRELHSSYQIASEEPGGTGSVARRKETFHICVESCSSRIFAGCTRVLFNKLNQAAESIGTLLQLAFSDVSEKVEANVSVLWDVPTDNKEEMLKRYEVVEHARGALYQLELWATAENMWADAEAKNLQTYFNEES